MIEYNDMETRFHSLFEAHYSRVYGAALRVTKDPGLAEDVLQETFIKAFHKMDEVDNPEKVGAWLSTIASRKAIDFLRKEKRVVVVAPEDLPRSQESAMGSDVEVAYEQNDFEKNVHERILKLPAKLKVVFLLSYYKGLREKEIAEKLGLTNGAVKSRLHRARLSLRTKIVPVLNENHIA